MLIEKRKKDCRRQHEEHLEDERKKLQENLKYISKVMGIYDNNIETKQAIILKTPNWKLYNPALGGGKDATFKMLSVPKDSISLEERKVVDDINTRILSECNYLLLKPLPCAIDEWITKFENSLFCLITLIKKVDEFVPLRYDLNLCAYSFTINGLPNFKLYIIVSKERNILLDYFFFK